MPTTRVLTFDTRPEAEQAKSDAESEGATATIEEVNGKFKVTMIYPS